MTAENAFDELEWRSYAVMAAASHTIVRVAKQSRIAQRTQREILCGRILLDVRSMSSLMLDLLNIYHAPDAIPVLEAATPEYLGSIVEATLSAHSKVKQTLAMIHPPGHWKSLYRPYLEKLKAYNDELESHIRAFSVSDSALILLTKRDQDHLVESLLNPPEPNAALRRAFARK